MKILGDGGVKIISGTYIGHHHVAAMHTYGDIPTVPLSLVVRV